MDSIRKKPAGKEGLGIASIPSRKDKGKEKEKEPEDLFAVRYFILINFGGVLFFFCFLV